MYMNEINLENLIPSSVSFKLKQFDDFEFKLEPCTGGKLIEMSKKIGDVEKLLSIPNAENVSKISIMLMEYESALKFKKQKIKKIDVLTGDEETLEIGGYELLMNCIRGIDEQFAIYSAILQSLGYDKKKAESVVRKFKDGINKVVNDQTNEGSKKKTKKKKIKKA